MCGRFGRRKRYEEAAGAAPEPSPAPTPPAEAAAAKSEAAKPAPTPEAALPDGDADHLLDDRGAGPGRPGPVGFLQLVGKLYQEGLDFMRLFDDPQTGQSMANFPVASWHIDILGLLEEKTKGNLTDEESKLLKEAISNLKVTLVRASGYIKH